MAFHDFPLALEFGTMNRMRIHPIHFIIIGCIVLIYVLLQRTATLEGFEATLLDMYVISLRHADRLKNIEKQEYKIGRPIPIVEGVKGDFINIPLLVSFGLVDPAYLDPTRTWRQKREIGCFLGHLYVIEKIKARFGYTIVFEDDFNITDDNFYKNVLSILQTLELKKIEFDLLFLGTSSSNKGTVVLDPVYAFNKNQTLTGTYGYVVKNKNVPKILGGISVMYLAIDEQYEDLGKRDKLSILIVDPPLVHHQDNVLPSTIENREIET
jgi:GR25 family glycosyltransferase involved in LPS biosynthesis